MAKMVETNSRKSVRWSSEPVPCLSSLWLKLWEGAVKRPEGVDNLCFHAYEEFGSWGWDLKGGQMDGWVEKKDKEEKIPLVILLVYFAITVKMGNTQS